MKYALIDDLSNIFLKKKRILFFWLFFLIAYPVFIKLVLNIDFSQLNLIDVILKNIGSSYYIYSIFDYLIMILSVSLYSYLSIDTYVKDIMYGKENIFLRLNKGQWLFRKILIIIIYSFLIEAILFTAIGAVYYILDFTVNIQMLFNLFLIDLMLKIIAQFFAIIFTLIIGKYGFVLMIIIYTIPFVFPFLSVTNPLKIFEYFFAQFYIGNLLLLFTLFLIVLFILAIISKLKLIKFFERCGN